MSSQVFQGTPVGLSEMLQVREERAEIQGELLASQPDGALLSVTLNIPGPVKTSPMIQGVFCQVKESLLDVLTMPQPLATLSRNLATGNEFYALFALSPEVLKGRMMTFEIEHPLGRLLDLDVVFLKEGKLTGISRQDLGAAPRKCLLCGQEAKACGRSRRHSVAELQEHITTLIERNQQDG